jgi:hypothetical protein
MVDHHKIGVLSDGAHQTGEGKLIFSRIEIAPQIARRVRASVKKEERESPGPGSGSEAGEA